MWKQWMLLVQMHRYLLLSPAKTTLTTKQVVYIFCLHVSIECSLFAIQSLNSTWLKNQTDWVLWWLCGGCWCCSWRHIAETLTCCPSDVHSSWHVGRQQMEGSGGWSWSTVTVSDHPRKSVESAGSLYWAFNTAHSDRQCEFGYELNDEFQQAPVTFRFYTDIKF